MSALSCETPKRFLSSLTLERISEAGVEITSSDFGSDVERRLRGLGENQLARDMLAEIDSRMKEMRDSAIAQKEQARIDAEKAIENRKREAHDAAMLKRAMAK